MDSSRLGVWIAIGMGLGVAFGAAFGDIGLGVALGPAIGIAIWAVESASRGSESPGGGEDLAGDNRAARGGGEDGVEGGGPDGEPPCRGGA